MKKLLSAGVACAGLPLVLLAASPADAGTRWSYRSSELRAEAGFLLLGAVDGAAGNIHVGNVGASSDGTAWGTIADWTCPDGEYPPYYPEEPIPIEEGAGGTVPGDPGTDEPYPPEEEPETNCVFEGSRDFWGEDLDVSISKKLASASVSGDIEVWSWNGEDEEGTSAPGALDLSFLGDGAATTSTEYSKGDGYVYKYVSTQRSATVTGEVAGLALDGAESWGSLVSSKSYERGSTR